MGVHIFLISLYAATFASFLVLGISLLGEVSPLGAGIRAAVAFATFTLLGLVARAAASSQQGASALKVRGQNVDYVLPATEAGSGSRAAPDGRPTSQGKTRG